MAHAVATKASLRFLTDLPLYKEVKPYSINAPELNIPRDKLSNIGPIESFDAHDVPITDLRGLNKTTLSYDRHGFRLVRHPQSSTQMFSQATDDVEAYCEVMIELIKSEFDAEAVLCYDMKVRNSKVVRAEYNETTDLSNNNVAPPIFAVHIDHTKQSGPQRIRRHLTDAEVERYLSPDYRARIVNVWRPLYRPVEQAHLAICAAHTINPAQIIAADMVQSDYVFDLYYARYHPSQEYYWVSRQTPEEVLIFVQFDTRAAESDDMVGACPHAAFSTSLDGNDGNVVPPRESIELRFIVFNKELVQM